MNCKLDKLNELISNYKLFENAIVFNGTDDPTFDLEKAKAIYQRELAKRVKDRIAEINEQIEICEEKQDIEKKFELIQQRGIVRGLKTYMPLVVNSIDDLKFPKALGIDVLQFREI